MHEGFKLLALLPLLALAVSGCSGIPVPPEKNGYIGVWQGQGVSLSISADGGVHYKKTSGGGNTEIQAPLQAFIGNDFRVGAMGMTTVFKVEQPPYQDLASDGRWKMSVDGVVLTRVP